MRPDNIVIAGGGLAAVRTAQALRDGGFSGTLTLVSDETVPPYDRPPLSKGFLTGAATETSIGLLAEAVADRLRIDVRLEAGAASLSPASRHLHLAGGETIPYCTLVIATGARPMTLSALAASSGVHVLRSLPDACRLRAALVQARSVAIVGGGLIGLEIASFAAARGMAVTVVEVASTPLVPVLGGELGQLILQWHERQGIVFRCGTAATGIEGGIAPYCLHLDDGSSLHADIVVVGIGTLPNTDWLHGSGLHLQRGLVVDDLGRSSDPHVFGVGDATCRIVGGYARPSRQWTATTEQARRAAKAILGDTSQPPMVDDNYFWSDQHGVRLQYAGSAVPGARLRFAVGSPGADKFLALCIDKDRVAAVFSLGLPRDFLSHSLALRRGETVSFESHATAE